MCFLYAPPLASCPPHQIPAASAVTALAPCHSDRLLPEALPPPSFGLSRESRSAQLHPTPTEGVSARARDDPHPVPPPAALTKLRPLRPATARRTKGNPVSVQH